MSDPHNITTPLTLNMQMAVSDRPALHVEFFHLSSPENPDVARVIMVAYMFGVVNRGSLCKPLCPPSDDMLIAGY